MLDASNYRPMIVDAFEKRLTEAQKSYDKDMGQFGSVMQYVLASQGKRIRPVLMCLCTELAGGDWLSALDACVSIEMVHNYSLVHDDLPCMDDDDFRRGRLTAHKKFGEAYGVLAGDGLLTDAFSVLVGSLAYDDSLKVVLMQVLSHAVGGRGMVLGQALDIENEGHADVSVEDLLRIHELKTGCLIGACCEMGAHIGGASSAKAKEFGKIGRSVGVIYQIIDDIIDEKIAIGKTSHKDAEKGKATFRQSGTWAKQANEIIKKQRNIIDTFLNQFDNNGPFRHFVNLLLERQR